MAAPATIVIAKLLRPETQESLTKGTVHLEVEKTATNVIEDAICVVNIPPAGTRVQHLRCRISMKMRTAP